MSYIFKNAVFSLILTWHIFFVGDAAYARNVEKISSDSWCFSQGLPHDRSDLQPDPNIIFGRLDNGFRYVLLPNNVPKDRVALYLDVQAGSIYETEVQRGYAHFLEHMLFNGSTHFKPGDLIEYFQSIGMDFGGDINAHTTFDETVYKVFLPRGGLEDIKKGFLVMMDYSRGALLLESEVERERKVILAEKTARDSISYRTRLISRKNSLRGTIIAKREPIGVFETLKSANSVSLRNFYDHWYRPEKMILVVVGDFDKTVVEPLLRKTFNTLQGVGDFPVCPDFGKLEHSGLEAFYHFESEEGAVSVSVESYWNKEQENDSFNNQVEQLKEFLVTRILQKRLELQIEKGDGVFTRAHAYSGSFMDRVGYTGLSASTKAENWQDSLTALEQGLRRVLVHGVTEEEVELGKKELVSYFESAALTAKTRKTSSLARQIVRSLNNNRVFQSPHQEKELYLAKVRSFTSTDINKAIQRLWAHDSRLIEVTGNVKIDTPNPEKTIKEVFLRAKKEEVSQPEEFQQITYPYLEVPAFAIRPIKSEYIDPIDTEIFYYKNGTVLNLKKTEYEKNKINIIINFGLGRQSEPVPGLSRIAESVVKSSGTGLLKESQLESVLASSSIEVDFNIQSLSFSIEGSSTANEIEPLLEALYTMLMDPALRKEVYQNKMIRYEQMFYKLRGDIQGAKAFYMDRFFAGGNTLFGWPAWREFSQLQLSQLKDWILPAFKKEPLEISVVGDFNRSSVVDTVSKYFGTLPKRKAAKLSHSSIQFPKGENLEIKIQSTIDKGLLIISWQTDDYLDISRTRRLSILAKIVEERVRIAVREKLGASYSPTVYNSSSKFIPGYGVLSVRMALEPQKIELARKAVMEICADLQSNGVNEEELQRAKEPVLTMVKDRVRNNDYWLYTVLSLSSVYPDQLKWPSTIMEDNSSITAAEMTEYARKYLKNQEAAYAVAKPAR